MEAIKNFCFDNFELLFVLGVIATGFGVMLFLFLFKSNNIADTKNQVLKAILNDSLDDFLESVAVTIKGTFDQAYEINKAADFLAQRLNLKTAKKIIKAFYLFDGSGSDEAETVFKRAFLLKGLNFWADLYVVYVYPAEDQETCQKLRRLFDLIYRENDYKNLWGLIYINILNQERNPEIDDNSAELLRREGQRIHEMLKPEKISPVLL